MGPGIGHDVGIAESRVDVGAEKGEGEVRDYPRDRKDSELGSHENRIQDIIIEIDGLRAEEEGEEGNECCHESRQLGLIGNVPASFPEMLCGGEEGATEFGVLVPRLVVIFCRCLFVRSIVSIHLKWVVDFTVVVGKRVLLDLLSFQLRTLTIDHPLYVALGILEVLGEVCSV